MGYLVAVSILWGFSFGLIKTGFSELSAPTLAVARLAIALPCFLPFLKARFVRPEPINLQLMATGGVQYGLMYLALFKAFTWLSGYEVALLTVFTPLYVIAAHAIHARRLPPGWFWWTALLAVAGAVWVLRPASLPDKLPGILLMQLSNICFAAGQVAWRHIRIRLVPGRDVDGYALLYLGGVLAALPFACFTDPLGELGTLTQTQWASLLYLGAIASGLGFFLWNAGAARVNAATLAVFNNLKIPIAVIVSVTVFGESANPESLVPGLLVLLVALGWAERAYQKSRYQP